MARQLQILPQAKEDLYDLASYIAKDSLPAALQLLDAAEASYDSLANTPFAGATAGFEKKEIHDLRVWRIKRYPNHHIFYRVTKDAVVIVRVIHAAQDRNRILGE